MPEDQNGGIFVSHSHDDRPIVDALGAMVKRLFGNHVPFHYSSSKELASGIAPGGDWYGWIVERVQKSDLAVIVLTPGSIQKPWVVWEAGAVSGVALSASRDERRICPMTFGLKSNEVPTPFARLQVVSGTEELDVTKFANDLLDRFTGKLNNRELTEFGANRAPAVAEFAGKVSQILLTLPHAITEAAIQEWLARLQELSQDNRFSEAVVIEDWLDVAFGRDEAGRRRPLDVRIHRRLAELYAAAKRPADAARQLELGRQLAPRDIFLLRLLGKAYLDQGDTGKAAGVLEDIEKLDSNAIVRNSENAALKARWFETQRNFIAARDVLKAAYNFNPNSYYLGDRLGQMYLQAGDMTNARDVYAQVRDAIAQLRGEKNVWTYATGLAAAIVLKDEAGIESAVAELCEADPSPGQMEAIERGTRGILQATGGDQGVLDALRQIKRNQAAPRLAGMGAEKQAQ
jgi:tetratricopeptide (TPR) repeat protein